MPTPSAGLVDLHRHLDGSLRPATLRELAERQGLPVPPDLAFSPGMGLHAALSRFAFVLSVLRTPDRVQRVASEICEDAAADGVTTLEIRFAPQLHVGGSVSAIVDAALAGIDGRAGLILCGLYGEDPAVLDGLVDVAVGRPGVVGLDLAGGPAPGASWGLTAYARSFRRAADLGLGRTVHAGEGRPPHEIRQAIEVLGAQRIGHGTTLLHDPAVLELVLDRGVTIEACPTSNVHTGVIPAVAAHPLPRWLDAGVRVTVCTDNTLLSAVCASEELERAASIPGMDASKVTATVEHGRAAAFRRGR
ncbi:MAG: adenosine deaminase [Myxococcota bacterium]|jgi:adenosine deaminase